MRIFENILFRNGIILMVAVCPLLYVTYSNLQDEKPIAHSKLENIMKTFENIGNIFISFADNLSLPSACTSLFLS